MLYVIVEKQTQKNTEWPAQEDYATVEKFGAQGDGFHSQVDLHMKTDSTKIWW